MLFRSKRPLTFVEFFERIPRGDYLLKYQYRVPILPPGQEYLPKIPANERVNYLTDPRLFADTWDATTPTIFRYNHAMDMLYALPQHKAMISAPDWDLFKNHYDTFLRKLYGPALAARVSTDTSLLYGRRPGSGVP